VNSEELKALAERGADEVERRTGKRPASVRITVETTTRRIVETATRTEVKRS